MRTWVHKIIEWYSSRKLKEKTTALFAVILLYLCSCYFCNISVYNQSQYG